MTIRETPNVSAAREIVRKHGASRKNLINILNEIQSLIGGVPLEAIMAVAEEMFLAPVEVYGVVSFYHFLLFDKLAENTIWLSKGAVPSFNGYHEIAKAFETELGIEFGKITPDGLIGLRWTNCIGMCDQEPAAIIDGVVFTKLTKEKVREIVRHLRVHGSTRKLAIEPGDGRNASKVIHASVSNNIRRTDDVLLAKREAGGSIRKLVTMTPMEVLEDVIKSELRGRGGAGFSCGMKWSFCLKSAGDLRYLACNADEGEPGTFKDRVLLTEYPELLYEGMVCAAYALGVKEGIIYLRAEYRYLLNHLEAVLDYFRSRSLLGESIGGKKGFDFDIRIQLGAGAYICGEETALLESVEGKRGEPRDRPPFPVSRGLFGRPTVVNNVETLCCVARVIENGADWFRTFGTAKSTGTKLLSISGDVKNPGVYEIPFGWTVKQILKEAGAVDTGAVVVGGPSGNIISPAQFDRVIGFEDLPTGGAFIVIGKDRPLLDVVVDFISFFNEESCGRCTPCRVGNILFMNRLRKIIEGRGYPEDLEYLKGLAEVMVKASRCGLGMTATNPVMTVIKNFPDLFDEILVQTELLPEFDLEKAMEEGKLAANRS